MAIIKPEAVVTIANPMSFASSLGSACPCAARVLNAPIIPTTVPRRPSIGAICPMTPKYPILVRYLLLLLIVNSATASSTSSLPKSSVLVASN